MPASIFTQNVIAVIWDFDRTLIPGNMQEPIFRHYGVDERAFWAEVDGLDEFHRAHGVELISRDALYLTHILTYARHGVFAGLNNALLRKLGAEIQFYPGMPDFLETLRKVAQDDAEAAAHAIQVEHYVVSTGLRQMILGSAVAPYLDGVWACEFAERIAPPHYTLPTAASPDDSARLLDEPTTIQALVYAIDNTTKTRAVFEINKGTNKIPGIDVNAYIKHEERRVPFQNMVYVADGPSDVPVFSVVRQYGGRTFAVYRGGSQSEFEQVMRLQEQGRIDAFGEANYAPGSLTHMWLTTAVRQIAHRIARDRELALTEKVGLPPRHLSDEPARAPPWTLPALRVSVASRSRCGLARTTLLVRLVSEREVEVVEGFLLAGFGGVVAQALHARLAVDDRQVGDADQVAAVVGDLDRLRIVVGRDLVRFLGRQRQVHRDLPPARPRVAHLALLPARP